MSKRKKNYPDPTEVLERYGADALRAYMIDSPVVRGEPLKFSERGLKEIVRTVVLPYWNALSFFSTYASVDSYDPRQDAWIAPPVATRPDIDRWALSLLQSLIVDVNREMEGYRLFAVVPRLVSFIDDLTNWYIRRSRPRFWKSTDKHDQSCAYATLLELLTTFSRVLAPFMPFVTEMVHQRLVVSLDPNAEKSVHFCDFPQADARLIDVALESKMQLAREVVVLCRKLREEHRIKVRQPLSRLTIVHRSGEIRQMATDIEALISDEMNVKEVMVEADESIFTTVSVKPNFKTLGKRCGSKLGAIKSELSRWSGSEVATLEETGSALVEGETLTLEDVILERSTKGDAAVATNGHITVVLDTNLSPELVSEGIAREFISQVQSARKSLGLEVSDRIAIQWWTDNENTLSAINRHTESIQSEVLARTMVTSPAMSDTVTSLDVNGIQVEVSISKLD